MLKDITLGQFFPGDTLAHKLDPRTKLLVTVFYVVALFTAKSYIAYGVLILTLIVAVRISRVGAKALFKGLKPVLFIIAFTALLNLFYTPGTELCHFWIFRITIEGVRAAITMMLRITLLIMGTFLLTYTTSPIRLTDGLESLLGPLKKIKVPVHELAMMMSIALRFIPTLIEETSAEIRKRVDDALEAVGMTQFVKHAPHLLSGGQKQRIAIAGVLAMKPECIVLDEATAMLDPIGRREVLAAVEKLNREQGITVVLITHHMNEAEHADRVIVMNDGLVVMDGKPREVFTRKKELEDIGLAVPDTVSLLFSLREAGMDVPVDAITVEECADAIAKNFT